MTEGPARSVGARRKRRIALAAAFCALAVGPACDRQTFDLLDTAGNAGVAGFAGAPTQPGAGASDTLGGGGNGNEAGAGKAGTSGAHAGSGGSSGFGGFGLAGSGGNPEGCLPGDPCGTDGGGVICPPSVSFCERCESSKECQDDSDSPYCLAAVGRCVQCRRATTTASVIPSEDCAVDEVCYPLTLRCAHACRTSNECADDHNHPVCDPQFGACVACTKDSSCRPFNGHPGYCAYGTCVECDRSNEEAASAAEVQCPDDKPYCVGLHCQNKPH